MVLSLLVEVGIDASLLQTLLLGKGQLVYVTIHGILERCGVSRGSPKDDWTRSEEKRELTKTIATFGAMMKSAVVVCRLGLGFEFWVMGEVGCCQER